MSSRFGSDGYTNSQRRRMAQVFQRALEQGRKDVEALQVRLEELGEPRISEHEMKAMAEQAASPESRVPQPKGRWLNGKFAMPINAETP